MENTEMSHQMAESTSNNTEMAETQGLEELSLHDEHGGVTREVVTEVISNDAQHACSRDEDHAVNGLQDIWKVNFKNIGLENVKKYHFPDLKVAYMFYNWYAAMNGFSARKSKLVRNKEGETIQQTFLCYREGYREDKFGNTRGRKREPKSETRCGCEAKCVVHVDVISGRWYIKLINDAHNHTLLEDQYMGMLPAHRKMSEADLLQMNSMRKVGISVSHIYGSFAHQSGGFENVGFGLKDMYNQVEKDRRNLFSDATAALHFLRSMGQNDPMMFTTHTVDAEGRLEHLFWCDGTSRKDYSVFGDVLAFDATYRKNKYLSPVVIFAGVNHHNQSIIFGTAIVANETEDAYVWVLEQLMMAMGGKTPKSVITDGDLAMKNAIRRVFPEAHHRLCAWHLARNATTNVGNKKFTQKFKKCMLGDYEVGEFKRKWQEMVTEFGLQDNTWVREMYDKRKMWATAHIRGNFFAGFRTTSRCEGLHALMGRYVSYQNNLVEFLQNYYRCISYIRYREVQADFVSVHGEPVMQTQLQSLERSAARALTRELFILFRSVLQRACTVRVVGCKQTASCYTYMVSKYCKGGRLWHVSFWPSSLEFRCSCFRMESLGIPCDHLIAVLVYLDIVELPECLVAKRWTKKAKEGLEGITGQQFCQWNSMLRSQFAALVASCERMSVVALCRPEFLHSTRNLVTSHTQMMEALLDDPQMGGAEIDPHALQDTVENPPRARTKGCGARTTCERRRRVRGTTSSQPPRCSVCRDEGHNRRSCPVQNQGQNMPEAEVGQDQSMED